MKEQNILTRKEKEILRYVIEYKRTNGISPTTYEIAEALYTSRSYVRDCLERLEDKRFIKYEAKKHRCIKVIRFI